MDSTITNKTAPLWVPRVIEERAWSHLGVRKPPAEVKWALLFPYSCNSPSFPQPLNMCSVSASSKDQENLTPGTPRSRERQILLSVWSSLFPVPAVWTLSRTPLVPWYLAPKGPGPSVPPGATSDSQQ